MRNQHQAELAEWIELKALNDFWRAAADSSRKALGMTRAEIGGAVLFAASNEPSILINRVIGLGMRGGVSQRDVTAIRDYYAGLGITDYFIQIQPWIRPARTRDWLADLGLERSRGWTQFARGSQAPEPVTSRLQVERIGRRDALDFARIAAQGFELSSAVVPVLAAMVGLPGWHHFMTFDAGRPVGTGVLRMEQGIGWLDWGATLPGYRGRGSQSLLLARRIQAALELNCHTLFSETGEAVPGDPQHSFRNLIRAGFKPTHTRENFSPGLAAGADQGIQTAV